MSRHAGMKPSAAMVPKTAVASSEGADAVGEVGESPPHAPATAASVIDVRSFVILIVISFCSSLPAPRGGVCERMPERSNGRARVDAGEDPPPWSIAYRERLGVQ
jgi:hypothetical protein